MVLTLFPGGYKFGAYLSQTFTLYFPILTVGAITAITHGKEGLGPLINTEV